VCVKAFSKAGNLHTHMRVHTGDKPSGQLFKTNSHLKLHVRIHTGAKPHSCRHCSQRFTQLIHLNRHLLKSHNEGTWLTCNICEMKFNESGNLKQHLLRHEGVKPYVCSQCAKCFCTVRDLNLINWYTRTTNSFAVVCVVKISNTNIMLCNTLRNVVLS